MAKSKYKSEYQDTFVKLYKEGMSIRAISRQYSINKGIVANLIREKVDIRPKTPFQTKESAKKVYELYLQGYKVNTIAKKLGVSFSAVRDSLRKFYGIVTSKRDKYAHLVNDFIKDYKDGMTLSEMEEKYNINRAVIREYLADVDLSMLRTYEETSRKYLLNQEYFDELNDYKAYQLGIIFSIGNAVKYNITKMIDLNVIKEKVYILDDIKRDLFVDRTPQYRMIDNTVKFRISSTKLYDSLIGYGFYSEKLKIPQKYIDSFMKGFFCYSLIVNNKYVSISFQYKKYTDFLIGYLVSKGITREKIKVKGLLRIEDKKEIEKFFGFYPEIMEKIKVLKSKEENLSNKWKYFIEKYGK